MSDVDAPAASFFVLYAEGRATRDDIEGFIASWHESGDDEQRLLPEFLGLTAEEYDVWLMDRRTLPLILTARRDGVSLRQRVALYLASLQHEPRAVDRPAIHALSYWVKDHKPA